jgi:hypothetical protein
MHAKCPSEGNYFTLAGSLPMSVQPHSVLQPSTATETPFTVNVLQAVMILLTP